ncbi:MAG: acyltransferase [Bacteroidales bacterium]|nr:acyltransferase [Bacteroidales bacterium]
MESIGTREPAIDLMRFLGLVLIMVAHLNLPADNIWFQLRTFDVPLMVFVSGLSYSGRSIQSYPAFVAKRAARILVPVYLFLTVFFLIHWATAAAGWTDPVPQEKIVGSYMLRLKPSINFVWIFRVFLIVMLLTPPLVALDKRVKGWLPAVLVFALMLAVQHVSILTLKPLKAGWFIDDWVLYAFGYGSVFYLGLAVRRSKPMQLLAIIAVLAAAFIPMAFGVAASKGSWLKMQSFKYPPGVYYLLWGALMSVVLWAGRKLWVPVLNWKPFLFIGSNTCWIYLWHIVFGYPYYRSDAVPYIWKFVLFLIVPSLIVFLQVMLANKLSQRGPGWNKVMKYFKG